MQWLAVEALASPLVSAGISVIGMVYWFGRHEGKTDNKLRNHETRITKQENQLQQKNGRPSYITRSEFDQDWKPYIEQLKKSINTIDGRMERIEAHLGVKE